MEVGEAPAQISNDSFPRQDVWKRLGLMLRTVTDRESYAWFPEAAARRDIAIMTERTGEYIRREGFKNVLMLDLATRPFLPTLQEYLKNRHPNELMPNMYLVNPNGFQTMTRSSEEVIADLEHTFPDLMAKREEPTLVYDLCIHTGEHDHKPGEDIEGMKVKSGMKAVLARLHEAGFTNIKIATALNHHNTSGIPVDMIALPTIPNKQNCHPLLNPIDFKKPFDSVVVQAGPSAYKDLSRKEAELRRIIDLAYPPLQA